MHLQTANFVVQYMTVENCDNTREQFCLADIENTTMNYIRSFHLFAQNVQYSTAYNARENFRNNIGIAMRDVKLLSI